MSAGCSYNGTNLTNSYYQLSPQLLYEHVQKTLAERLTLEGGDNSVIRPNRMVISCFRGGQEICRWIESKKSLGSFSGRFKKHATQPIYAVVVAGPHRENSLSH